MYSVLPAVVSALFLGYGLYVIAEKGFNRVSGSFFVLCITTFFWQGTWAVLFQVRDPQLAQVLIRFGYLLILFLPTSLYQFMVEISGRQSERPMVFLAYGAAAALGMFGVATDWVVEGHYEYFWGYYPKAGPLHPLHVFQTALVVSRGLAIAIMAQKNAGADQRMRLRLCIAGVFIFFLAAIDYLCNYGIEFYPPGSAFVTIGLGLIVVAVTRYDLMSTLDNAFAVGAAIAHELRTPLASMRMQADAIVESVELRSGAARASQADEQKQELDSQFMRRMTELSQNIQRQVDRSNILIDMMLAAARMGQIDTSAFRMHSCRQCVKDALDAYPFRKGERELVHLETVLDFDFFGSDMLFSYVIFNLLKNALYSLERAGRGTLLITIKAGRTSHCVTYTDSGCGIPADVLPRIFETFFTTKVGGAGIGLPFCRRVIESFGGRMHCHSSEGAHATFILEFPVAPS